MKKNILLLAMLFTISSIFIAQHDVAYGAKYTIKLGHPEPVATATHSGALKFKSLVEDRSGGEIEVVVHPSGELGTDVEMLEMTQMGNLQLVIVSTGHMGGIYPPIQLLDVPFLLPVDSRLGLKILNGRAGDMLKVDLPKKGLLGIAYYAVGVKQYTNNKLIQKPEDFKGLKIRVMPSPLIVESFKTLGATPVPLPYGEVYSALQLGTVDGQENPIWAIEKMKFYEVQKYVIMSNHGIFPQMMLANPKWYEGLPLNLQKIISDAGKEIGYHILEKNEEIDIKGLKTIKDANKAKVVDIPAENRQAFINALKPVRNKYVETVGKRGEEILKVFDEEIQKTK